MVDTDESVEAIRPEGEKDQLRTLVLIRQRTGTGFRYARVEGAKRNPIMGKVIEGTEILANPGKKRPGEGNSGWYDWLQNMRLATQRQEPGQEDRQREGEGRADKRPKRRTAGEQGQNEGEEGKRQDRRGLGQILQD
eukprot:707681-Rhodomonas_salina.1